MPEKGPRHKIRAVATNPESKIARLVAQLLHHLLNQLLDDGEAHFATEVADAVERNFQAVADAVAAARTLAGAAGLFDAAASFSYGGAAGIAARDPFARLFGEDEAAVGEPLGGD